MQLVALAVRAPEMTTPVTFTAQKLQVLLPSRLMYPMLSLSISRHRQPSEAMSFSAYLRMRWCDHCGGQVTYPPTQQHLFSNFIRATQRNTIVPPMLKIGEGRSLLTLNETRHQRGDNVQDHC